LNIKEVKEIFSQIILFLEEIGVELRKIKSKIDIREGILLLSLLCYRTVTVSEEEYSSLGISHATLDNAWKNLQ